MHRTTISLESVVERELRRLAAKKRLSFKELVNDLIKRGLQAYRVAQHDKKTSFSWHTIESAAHSTFNPADRSTYLDLISRKY